jgi:UPF0755 protein
MMVAVRSRALTLLLAVVAAVAAVAIFALAVRDDDVGDGPVSDDPAAVDTSVPVTEASLPEPVPTRPATTTALAPATTTTQLTTTTTSLATILASNGYTFVPKPSAGPDTVAPGGALTKHLTEDIATAFGLDTAEVQTAITGVELPPEAGGSPEGWLAPGTYDPGDQATALEVVQAMVDRRVAQLEERGVPRDQWHGVLTAASVIETETYNQNEKPRVARVLTNRLDGGGPLQMDSIILYPVPEDRIFTTSEERASDQPYNSYRRGGLPPTPISAPDEASLDAFLAPPPGDWWFYVTIDLDTGETRYAAIFEEHQTNVTLLRDWLRDNPSS